MIISHRLLVLSAGGKCAFIWVMSAQICDVWFYYSILVHYCLFKQAAVKKKQYFFLSWGVLRVGLNCFLLLIHRKGLRAENNVTQMHTCDRAVNAAQTLFLFHNTAAHLHPVSNFKPRSTFSDWCILPRRLLPRQHKKERRGLWLHDNRLPPPTTSFGLLYCLPQGFAAYW